MSGIYLVWLIIALITIWAGFKAADDVHRIALMSLGLFFIILFLLSTPESVQLVFKFIFFAIVLFIERFLWRSFLSPQLQQVEQKQSLRN